MGSGRCMHACDEIHEKAMEGNGAHRLGLIPFTSERAMSRYFSREDDLDDDDSSGTLSRLQMSGK